jgi:hypothetical protein
MGLGEGEASGGQSAVLSPRSFWRISSSSNPPLRIGLLVDGVRMSRFFATIIEDIQASNFANIELLVFRRIPASENSTNPADSKVSKAVRRLLDPQLRKHTLYEQYLRFDEKKKPSHHPLDQVDCSRLLTNIESIEIEPIGKKFVHRFPPEAIEAIRAKKLDVLLRFGFNILRGDILQAARYGVWSYHHGDNEFFRGGPPHFWELYEGALLSGVLLQVLTEELDAGLVLCKSLFATETTISVSRNRYPAYWGSTDLVIRKLHELHRFGWDYLREHSVPSLPYKGKKQIYRMPTNFEMVRWLGPVVLKKALRQLVSPTSQVQHWRIGVRTTGQLLFDQPGRPNLSDFRWLEPPSGHFWADPFVIDHDNRKWAFFEEYAYQYRRAHIACAEISPNGSFLSPTRCLADDHHHFSYPHVFREGAELFMIPESVDSASVDLYRCEKFPHQWVRQATLLRGRFVDTNIWFCDDTWWLTTTSAEPDARAGSLLLFYADSITGPWQFHPANPISTDVRNFRNAGRVFQTASSLLRPSQNCAGLYGRNLALNEITELTKLRYAERTLLTVEPEVATGVCGIHTYNWCGNVELIDGQARTSLKRVLPGNSSKR